MRDRQTSARAWLQRVRKVRLLIFKTQFNPIIDEAKRLVASVGDEAYLDQISAPRLDPSGKRILRPMHRKGKGSSAATGIEIYEDEEEDDGGADGDMEGVEEPALPDGEADVTMT